MTKKDKIKASRNREQRSTRKNDEYWWLTFATLVVLSGLSRFYKVSEPDHVCWDETHFGKMGSWYINRTFFFDVHPPLGKMLIGLSGYLTGYDGTFPFDKPGDKYNDVKYIGMRAFCTFLGACLVPFAFLIIWEMTKSIEASTISSLLILCDVGIVTLTRYILLDPLLLFFMMASILSMAKLNSNFEKPFTIRWWGSLISTGVTMACCISIKFVGLFTAILIGFNTIYELWKIAADISKPFTYTIKHFLARTLGLIVLPIMVYVGFFYIHLMVLHKSGNGDGFYSSAFQSKLEGNSLFNASMPRDVAYGAVVTLKNHRTGAGYLHSHWHLYPEGVGAKQQQITTYTHKDENNQWRIKPKHRELSDNDSVEFVKHGDLIRLEHVQTKRNLHSHRERAPVTKKHYQVTGYGENGIGDSNDVWRVTISGGGSNDDVIKTVTTKINLIHFMQRCVLTTTGKQLPKWAFEQQEVTCNPNLRDSNGVWNIEDNVNPKLPNVSFELYAASFWERLVESHLVMFRGNSGLKPKEGEVTSRPWQWPINYKGQFFSGNEYKIYLLGNPVIWWSNLIFLFVYMLIFTWNSIRTKRGYDINLDIESVRMLYCCGWLFTGWLLHYIPFWAMGRVLYFHHYFPALLFNSMLSGVVLSYILRNMKYFCSKSTANVIRHIVLGTIYSVVGYTFYLFCPLSYGLPATPATERNSTMFGLRWMDSWEF